MRICLDIGSLSHRGTGQAATPSGLVEVPFTLPGEAVDAEVEGDRGTLCLLRQASLERVSPPCPYFGSCGGCALQHCSARAYSEWKRSLIVSALSKYGLTAPVSPLLEAHGIGRRRVSLHARPGRNGEPHVGFMASRSHDLVDIRDCLVLSPELKPALAAARDLAHLLIAQHPTFDLQFTAVLGGLDCDIRGFPRSTSFPLAQAAGLAERHKLLRLSLHGEPVVTLSKPYIDCAGARLFLPPGAFLQATAAGEEALADFILRHAEGVRRAADLFCGLGPFALRLARSMPVLAVDTDRPALDALVAAARNTERLKPVTAVRRNLFKEPLVLNELDPFDLVVFDPPRQGAEAQARQLARARCKRIIAISCNPLTFARDAAILLEGGYRLKEVVPVDQFKWSAHVEVAALFVKASKPR